MARHEKCSRCRAESNGRNGTVLTSVEIHAGSQTVKALLCCRCWREWLVLEDLHVKDLINFLFQRQAAGQRPEA